MFLAYLDASGCPRFAKKENYVLASLIIEKYWQYIDNAVKNIKLKHFPTLPDTEIEIHAKDIHSKTGIFAEISWNSIYAIYDDVFDCPSYFYPVGQ